MAACDHVNMAKTLAIKGGKGSAPKRRLEYSDHPRYGCRVFYNGRYQSHTLRAWFEPDPDQTAGWRFRAKRSVGELTADQVAGCLEDARTYLRYRGLRLDGATFEDIAALARGGRRPTASRSPRRSS